MQAQIIEYIPATTSAAGKAVPPKVKLNDGKICTMGKGVNLGPQNVGSFGEAEIETSQNGQYTNHRINAWKETTPAGQPASYAEQGRANAVPDAKDRSIAAQVAIKAAAEITVARVTTEQTDADLIAGTLAMATAFYEFIELAKADRLATAANPFAQD